MTDYALNYASKSTQTVHSSHWLQSWQPQALKSEARTLPAELYTSPKIYRLEQQQIFGKAWYYVGHLSQLQGANSYFTVEIAEQPLVIVQDQTNQLRAFLNICPYQAAPIAFGSGQCDRFTRPYHAWSFDLTGRLIETADMEADMETTEEFDRANSHLTAVQIDTWGAFIFVNLDPNCEPLAVQLGELPEMFKRYQLSTWRRIHSIDYWTETNWKLYVDNNTESYHEASVHAGYLKKYAKTTTAEARNHYYLQYAPLAPDDDLRSHMLPGLYAEGLSESEQNGKSTISLFPNFAWILRPCIAVIYLIDPQGPQRTRIRWDWLVPDTEAASSAENIEPLIQFFDKLQQEDLNLLPDVQKAIQSRGYRPGRLSPTREVGTHLFQQLVMRYLSQRD